jgi:hypothetical protein
MQDFDSKWLPFHNSFYYYLYYKDDLNLNNDEAKETGYLHVETSKDSDIIDLPQKDDESIL